VPQRVGGFDAQRLDLAAQALHVGGHVVRVAAGEPPGVPGGAAQGRDADGEGRGAEQQHHDEQHEKQRVVHRRSG